MVAWVKTGTVNVTLNSATVQGVNTKFVDEFREGDGFVGPDDRLYEVLNLPSQTQMTLGKPYKGPTASAQAYAVAPIQGYLQRTADRLAGLANQAATLLESPTINALAAAVGAANKMPRFTGAGAVDMVDARAFGLSLLAAADKTTALTALDLNIGMGVTNNTAQVINFNSMILPGQIVCTAVGSTNGPINAIGFLEVVGTQNANRVSQRFTELNGGGVGTVPRVWLRTNIDTNWSPWALMITATNWMPITINVSADTLTDANMTWYVQGSTVTELPIATTGILRCLFRGDAGGAARRCIQEYTPFEPANGGSRVWRRTRDETNAWSAWTRTDNGALGTAAQGTLTTSMYDTNPGRVTRVGDYGVGATGLADVTYSSVGAGGFYRSFNDASAPSLSTHVGLHVQREAAGRALTVVGGDVGNKLYFSNRNVSGAAQAWKEVVAVGDYGLGSTLAGLVIAATAMNTQLVTGWCYVLVTGGQGSAPVNTNGYLETMAYATNYAVQRYTVVNAMNVWQRMLINGTWTGWSPVYNATNIVGTVTTASGVPTGAIIERGNNAQGNWTKYADGTMECWGIVGTANITPGATVPSAAPVTLPRAFVDTNFAPLAQAAPAGGWDGFDGVVACVPQSTTVFNAYIRNRTTTQTAVVTWRAVGRWN